ncbi:MAG: efflux RND transporter periplasmic adaptor subunit [Pseudomonadota bacterium]
MGLRPAFVAIAALLCAACEEEDRGDGAAPVRGVITTVVEAAERSVLRRYPGVLEPKEITSLSFEVGGKLGELALSVGQRVSKGERLASLDSAQFLADIANKRAAVAEAEATLAQDTDDLARQEELLKRGAVTRVSVDEARTDFKTSAARLTQAQQSLTSAEEDLLDAEIFAPFDGIINSIDADSFATVSAGATVTSIYDASLYEVSFSVNFDTISRLVVGTPAKVRLADDPDVELAAVVSELGERADTVSSFPVIVQVQEDHPLIRAGMAVEASFEFALPAEIGYLIPISAAITEGQIPETAGPNAVSPLALYVFDPPGAAEGAEGAVRRREVKMAGIRGNQLLIIEGLTPGERVAIAGVSFLRDGMVARLLAAKD